MIFVFFQISLVTHVSDAYFALIAVFWANQKAKSNNDIICYVN